MLVNMDKFTKYCRCSGFDGGMQIGWDGKLYCPRCGLPLDDYVEGFKEFDAEIIEFPQPEKKEQ
jgi:hypothetical protein